MLPLLTLPASPADYWLAHSLQRQLAIEGTSKRKVDGSLAATRLGSSTTERWANERFRQTMLLVREFRMEWPNMRLLTADDVENIRWLLDCAMFTATRTDHKADIYDMNPTCYAIWLVQNQHALKAGGWKVESAQAQTALSFEGLYRWLEAQHARGESRNLYDPLTLKLLKRYKLPFKKFTVPPEPNNLFKYLKGARRLSTWIYNCQAALSEGDRPRSMGLAYGIVTQKPPELVAAPPQAARAAERRQAIWNRVVARARPQRPLQSAQEDSEDAELTRGVVAAVVLESNRVSDTESTVSDGELERELEETLRSGDDEQPAPPQPDADSQAGEFSLEEMERIFEQLPQRAGALDGQAAEENRPA